MFKKLSTLLLALPLISALTLNQPTTQVYSSSQIDVSWTVASGDPTAFDIYLDNPSFRNTFAVANNVQTSNGSINITLPAVPEGPGYYLQASPVGNVNTVLSQTSTFDIAAALSSSLSPTSSGTGTVSSGTGLSATTPTSTPLSGSSSSSSSTVLPTGSFNGGSNGALTFTGIGATVVGALVAAGAFFA
ncbi:hypothetical protein BJ322DRAFT_668635 [Thelephora terrestris]|uniref:Yeast cell wall synthesis Kre9/Knh1-like N-terminal domain-containing protein n=1 Tax=Thelephora terrestris TaxID=56493 RepID=A0A9P6HGM6_9AGAM|nr:hypothetical protein BJ322DRAFT_668635 [Thelephora terrestris]